MSQETKQTEHGTSASAEDVYPEIRDFLYEEAYKLDNKRFDEWLELMSEDIRYRVPTRVTTAEGGKDEFKDDLIDVFNDNRYRLEKRVERLKTEHAWAEQPPSRTRHLISNIMIDEYDPDEGRAAVRSSLVLYVHRGGVTLENDADDKIELTGEREDELQKVNGDWKLQDRSVYLDHEVIPASKISVFI